MYYLIVCCVVVLSWLAHMSDDRGRGVWCVLLLDRIDWPSKDVLQWMETEYTIIYNNSEIVCALLFHFIIIILLYPFRCFLLWPLRWHNNNTNTNTYNNMYILIPMGL